MRSVNPLWLRAAGAMGAGGVLAAQDPFSAQSPVLELTAGVWRADKYTTIGTADQAIQGTQPG